MNNSNRPSIGPEFWCEYLKATIVISSVLIGVGFLVITTATALGLSTVIFQSIVG